MMSRKTTTTSSSSSSAKLDDQQISDLREVFRSFDSNKDGSLTQVEMGSMLKSLGLKPSPDQVEALINQADTNHNGLVEFSEFVAMVEPELLHSSRSPYKQEQLRMMFEMFDTDGNGYITAAELAHSMAKLGHPLTVDELAGMMNEADRDGDGRIDFEEFVTAITAAAFDNSWA